MKTVTPYHRRHLGLAIVIAVGLVGALLAGIWHFTRIPAPELIFADMLTNTQKLDTNASSTDVQFTLKNEQDISIGGALRIESVAAMPADTLADYATRISGQINYRSGETRHTINGTLEARAIDGRYYLRLDNVQLSTSLQDRWESYLNIFKGSWYVLPADTLSKLTAGKTGTLTAVLTERGLIQPSTANRIDRDSILLEAQLDPTELRALSRYFLVSSSIAEPPAHIPQFTVDEDGDPIIVPAIENEKPAPRAYGTMDITLNAVDKIAREIRGELTTETAIFGGAELAASWQTRFKQFNTAPTPNIPPDPGPPSEVIPEGVIEFDLRTLF